MLFDPNIDTKEDVLKIRQNAFTALKNGQTVMSWSNEGSSANLQFTLPVETVLIETKAFLQMVDPDKYGRRVKVASPRFT